MVDRSVNAVINVPVALGVPTFSAMELKVSGGGTLFSSLRPMASAVAVVRVGGAVSPRTDSGNNASIIIHAVS